jgi:uncharacterized coiled-coil protein SlyX
LVCGHIISSPSITPIGLSDIQPLGTDSGNREEGENKPTSSTESEYNPLLGLLNCPECSQRALFWNRHDQIYKCVNPKCKRSFTIEEYKNREVHVLPKERQSEQIPSSVSTDKAKERMKRATKAGKHKQSMKLETTELISSGVATIESKEKTQELGITEQIPSSVAPIEPKERTQELGTTEQIPSSAATTEPEERTQEPGATEQIPSGVATIDSKERTQEPGITEQIPFGFATIESKEGTQEPGITEQKLPGVATIESKERTQEPGTTEQIPSGVATIESKERTQEPGIRQILSSGSAIEARGGVKRSIRAAKQMNRNLAFLLIAVLTIGLVILGVLQMQKPGNDDELSSQLDQSRQTITGLQAQLAASQQDVKELTDQLTQAQQKIEALQTEINKLKSPSLTPSEPFVYSGGIYRDSQLSFPIDLKQFENVQGEVTGGYPGLEVYIKDSAGSIVKDFGRNLHVDFTFTAQISGGYAIVIEEPNGSNNSYTLQYTIYQRQ